MSDLLGRGEKEGQRVWLEQSEEGDGAIGPRAQGPVGLVGSYQFRFYSEQNGKDRREGPWSPQSCRGRKGTVEKSPTSWGSVRNAESHLRGEGVGLQKHPVGLVQAPSLPLPSSLLFIDSLLPPSSHLPCFHTPHLAFQVPGSLCLPI